MCFLDLQRYSDRLKCSSVVVSCVFGTCCSIQVFISQSVHGKGYKLHFSLLFVSLTSHVEPCTSVYMHNRWL